MTAQPAPSPAPVVPPADLHPIVLLLARIAARRLVNQEHS